jgi:proline iminopeptidase
MFQRLALAAFLLPSFTLAQTVVHETGVIHTPQVEIGYETFGTRGDALPVIAVNGGPGLSHAYMMMNDLWQQVARDRLVVLYDQRGTGASERVAMGAPQSMDAQVEDLEAVRAHFGIEKVALLGDSYGGFLVMAYAAKHPNHVANLVLSDSPPPSFKEMVHLLPQTFPDIEEWDQAAEKRLGADSDAAARESLRNHFRMIFYSPQKRDAYMARMGDLGYQPAVARAVSQSAGELDLSAALPAFHFPVLILTGRWDMNVAPINAWKMAKAIPGGERASAFVRGAREVSQRPRGISEPSVTDRREARFRPTGTSGGAATLVFAIGVERSRIVRHRIGMRVRAGIAGQARAQRFGAHRIGVAVIGIGGDRADAGAVGEAFSLNPVFRQLASGEKDSLCLKGGPDMADSVDDPRFIDMVGLGRIFSRGLLAGHARLLSTVGEHRRLTGCLGQRPYGEQRTAGLENFGEDGIEAGVAGPVEGQQALAHQVVRGCRLVQVKWNERRGAAQHGVEGQGEFDVADGLAEAEGVAPHALSDNDAFVEIPALGVSGEQQHQPGILAHAAQTFAPTQHQPHIGGLERDLSFSRLQIVAGYRSYPLKLYLL